MTFSIDIKEAEFSINLALFFAIVIALMGSGSTTTTMAIVSNQTSSRIGSNSNPGQPPNK